MPCILQTLPSTLFLDCESVTGSLHAFFRGNGTNVIKIAPETGIKLAFNDRIKRMVCADPEQITPLQRLFAGAMSGAVAQVLTT